MPDGDAFEFTIETEDYIDGSIETLHGDGQTGWCVAVSLLAPFAVITLGERIAYNNGDIMEPVLESPWKRSKVLLSTPSGISARWSPKRRFPISRRCAARLRKPSKTMVWPYCRRRNGRNARPRLRLGDGVPAQEPLRVLDALFFEEI